MDRLGMLSMENTKDRQAMLGMHNQMTDAW
jgi:hypothetical protein